MLTSMVTYDQHLDLEELEQRRRGRITKRNALGSSSTFFTRERAALIIVPSYALLPSLVLAYMQTTGLSRYLIILGLLIFWGSMLVFSLRIIALMQVYHSREHLDRRGYGYRYRVKYYLYILFALSLYSFPLVLLVTIGYKEVNEINMAFSDDLGYIFFWIIFVVHLPYIGFIVGRLKGDSGLSQFTGKNNMQTYFFDEKIVVEGKHTQNSYHFSFTRNEIRSFVIFLFNTTEQHKPFSDDAILDEASNETWILCVENKRGYLHNISFYIQEKSLQEGIISTLKKKYGISIIHIPVQSIQNLRDIGVGRIHLFSSLGYESPAIRREVSFRSPLFFPEFIKKGKERKQMSRSLQAIEDVNKAEGNVVTPLRLSNINIRERLMSPYWYGLNDTIVCLMVAGVAIVNGLLTQSVSIFFLTFILGAPSFVIPTRKWYHLGIDKLPVCFALLCTLFYLL